MNVDKPGGGRTKNVVSGGGNASKGGEGLATGPVGGASRVSGTPSGKDDKQDTGDKRGKGK